MVTKQPQESGYILATVVVFAIVLLGLGLLILQSITSLTASVQGSINIGRAAHAANAGLASAVQCVNTDSKVSWSGTLDPTDNCSGTVVNGQPSTLASSGSWTSTFGVSATNSVNRLTLSSIGSMTQGTLTAQTRNLKVDIPKTTLTVDPAPTTMMSVAGAGGLSKISTGTAHTCAIASGKAYCWGSNLYGELGDRTTTSRSRPVAVYTGGVLSGKTVTDIEVGNYLTCAVADGKAYCWGGESDEESHGQLGVSPRVTVSSTPLAVNTNGVLSGKTVTKVAVSRSSVACAIADGRAYCWGRNDDGQLGNNSTQDSDVPVAVYTGGVLNNKTVVDISISAYATMLIYAIQK